MDVVINELNILCNNIVTKYKTILLSNFNINDIFDIIFSLNYINSYINLFKLLKKDIKLINNKIDSLSNDLFTNKNILNFLNDKEYNIKDIEELLFVKKIAKKMTENKTKINKYSNDIINKLNITYQLNSSSEIKNELNNSNIPKQIILTQTNYLILLKKIKNSFIRKKIEEQYYHKTIPCLSDFINLIKERHNFIVNKKKYQSYLQYIRPHMYKNIDDIYKIISDLNNKIKERYELEINRIHRLLKKDGYDKQVDTVDIIYYKNLLESKYVFDLNIVINSIFKLIYDTFKISFTKLKLYTTKLLWNDKIDIYKIDGYNGFLYIDNNTTLQPLCFCLTHRFIQQKLDNTSTIIPPQVVILSNLKQKIKYYDIIALMKEFGVAIRYLTLQTTMGTALYDNEFNNLVPNIMEHLFWDNIKLFDPNLNDTNIEKIKFSRYIDFAYSIKIKCVNALFDYIINCHSNDIIPELKSDNDMEKIYIKIYKMQMETINFNINVIGINPAILFQEVNGNEGILYENILCDIFAYSIYSEIKKGRDFVNDVLVNNINSIGSLTRKFLSNIKSNSYYDYLEKVINYNEIATDMII